MASALLLFLVQPMFAKMVLPSLGGTPQVWNTCMVFFQGMLLVGYAYAHLGSRWLAPRRQAAVHVGLLLLSLLMLPIWPRYLDPGEAAPIPWLVGLMLVSLGVPFFMLSASAPLLQRWFAASTHERASDPYFLYGASNLGSMAALIGYPVLVEPLLTLRQQSAAWSWGYTALAALIGLCALLLHLTAASTATAQPTALKGGTTVADQPVTFGRRMRWAMLAFAPSSLLLGVTTHITTDVAAIPLLWVAPLALYLLTFVVVFARRPVLKHAWMVRIQPFVILAVLIPLIWNQGTTSTEMALLHLLMFFSCAMVCHGELANDRPDTRHLTEFYLWMSVGGVLGGIFNALLAPLVFNRVIEYPIAIAIACALRPTLKPGGRWALALDIALPVAVVAALLTYAFTVPQLPGPNVLVLAIGVIAAVGVIAFWFRTRPIRFGLLIGLLFLSAQLGASQQGSIAVMRSFFGVHQIATALHGNYRVLIHGTTIHGAQAVDPSGAREPLTYFHRDGPLGQTFLMLDQRLDGKRIGVAGLGAGTIACYARPRGRMTFYEIDPMVVEIASNPKYFSYVTQCGRSAPNIVLGDARLTMAREPDGDFALLILDAFSSDSVPVHLITQQAVEMYLRKLAPGGVLAFNISNRYLDLAPVLAAIARNLGLVGRVSDERPPPRSEARWHPMRSASGWVVLARERTDLGSLWWDHRWAPLPDDPRAIAWTDDFSNIIGTLRAFRGRN